MKKINQQQILPLQLLQQHRVLATKQAIVPQLKLIMILH